MSNRNHIRILSLIPSTKQVSGKRRNMGDHVTIPSEMVTSFLKFLGLWRYALTIPPRLASHKIRLWQYVTFWQNITGRTQLYKEEMVISHFIFMTNWRWVSNGNQDFQCLLIKVVPVYILIKVIFYYLLTQWLSCPVCNPWSPQVSYTVTKQGE